MPSCICSNGRLCRHHAALRDKHNPQQIQVCEDVLIPSAGEFGYVDKIADGMVYVKNHDGLDGSWYFPDEVAVLGQRTVTERMR